MTDQREFIIRRLFHMRACTAETVHHVLSSNNATPGPFLTDACTGTLFGTVQILPVTLTQLPHP
jgi:hypothetical protein